MVDSIIWNWSDSSVSPSSPPSSADPETILGFDPRDAFFSLDTLTAGAYGTMTPSLMVDLSDCAIIPLFGKLGYLAPQRTLIEDKIPQLAGSLLRQINTEPRKIDLPFILKAPSYSRLIALFRNLTAVLMRAGESGKLIFRTATGEEKSLFCTYFDGLMGDDNDDNQFIVWAKVMLSFVAHDPYFYYINDPQNIAVKVDNPPVFFDTTFFPIGLAQSTFDSTPQDVVNTGDAEAWPVWLIKGPITGTLSFQNLTTGKVLTLNQISEGVNIVEGETVVIDTRPGFKTVMSSQLGDIFGRLSNNSSMWSLQPGINSVSFVGAGFSSSTEVYYKYDTPYLTY